MRGHVSEGVDTLPRDILAQALGGNSRVVAAFEQQALDVTSTKDTANTAAVATSAIQDASFLVLGPNETLTGERVFNVGAGLTPTDDGSTFGIAVSDEVAHVQGGFPVYLSVVGPTNLVLPLSGTLATRSGSEVLTNKTLNAPSVVGIADFTGDVAAAAGGVPVGGVYRSGAVLMVRVA